MADDVAITAGAGTNIAADDCTTGFVQLVKLAYGADGDRTQATVDANGVLVNLGTNNDVTVTGSLTNISGTVSLPTGASTAAKQPALGTAGTASTDVITVQGITSMTPLLATLSGTNNIATVTTVTGVTTVSTVTNLSQLGGTAIAMNTGTRSAGTQRVTIATDDVVPASQSGTWTVQPGNTANTTPWLVSLRPSTAGGLTPHHLVSAASTNATVVKASAGQLYGWYVRNGNASMRKVAFHNTASTPTAGASIYFTLNIPGNSAANVAFPNGINFSTGIAYTTVTGIADTDATAVASQDLTINLFYN